VPTAMQRAPQNNRPFFPEEYTHMNLKFVKIMKRTKNEQFFCWASYKGYLLFIDEQIEYTTSLEKIVTKHYGHHVLIKNN
jgi:hypothetical protein